MRGISGYFGLGIFAGFLVFNTAGAYLMGAFDRGIGLSAAIRFSIVLVIILSCAAASFFSTGLRTDSKISEGRAMLLGLLLSAGYWALIAIASALLVPFYIELPSVLAVIPFLVICVFASKFVSVRQ